MTVADTSEDTWTRGRRAQRHKRTTQESTRGRKTSAAAVPEQASEKREGGREGGRERAGSQADRSDGRKGER
jgi:hypothetical protein